jgi:CRISPR type III-B/RAMP module RAMP protein Cmr6
MYLLNEVGTAIREDDLSASLRLTRYAHIGETSKKDPVDWICRGRQVSRPTIEFPGAAGIPMKLMGRLIVDQAGGVLENANLRLHRHFSCPFIPGSACKGVARHAAWTAWHNAPAGDKKKELARKTALTFGYPTGDAMPSQAENRRREEMEYLDNYLARSFPTEFDGDYGCFKNVSGTVAFLPAYPVGTCKLVADVLTCHHMNYYSGKENQARDCENPNPQFFPAVEAGTTFLFQILPCSRKYSLDFSALAFAKEQLRRGLLDHGIGAKTAAGYGWFEDDKEAEAEIERLNGIRRQEREEKRRIESLDPVEKAMEIMEKDDLAVWANKIDSLEERESRALIRLLAGERNADWKNWVKRAKKMDKIRKRTDNVRACADNLGEVLP